MVWIRTKCKQSTVIAADLGAVRELLLDIVGCGLLMPSVHTLESRGDGVYHYRLDTFSNGAISMTPDYDARFDTSEPGSIRWEPHGEHNFKSWGTFTTTPGPVAGEVVLEIDTHAEADVAIDRVLIALVEPFARQFMREVTDGFLANIKKAAQRPTSAAPAGTAPAGTAPAGTAPADAAAAGSAAGAGRESGAR